MTQKEIKKEATMYGENEQRSKRKRENTFLPASTYDNILP